MLQWGDETVVLFELDQPLCSLTYGTSPCQARVGSTGTRKCFNTRATCQDSAHYSPGTLTLRFARDQEDLLQYGFVIPSLVSLDTTPASINLGGMDRNSSALGKRETVTVRLTDHRYSDFKVDKYRLERGFTSSESSRRSLRRFKPRDFRWTGAARTVARDEFFGSFSSGSSNGSGNGNGSGDPYTSGTFWGKWLARNPYHQGSYPCRVYEGVLGQDVEDMRVRHYIVDRVEGPTNGQVTVVAKDLFSQIEAKKAVAPAASRGELSADIAASGVATFTLSPTGIGSEYGTGDGATQFWVAIGSEIIRVTRVGDVLTVVARNDLGTTAAAHKDDDLVQLVLAFQSQLAHSIVYTLATTYGGIDTSQIDLAAWAAAAAELVEVYTAYIAEPTPVNELIGELEVQAGFTVWPDVETGMIEFRALRAGSVSPVVDDEGWILDGSLTLKRQDAKRVSQVWVYYGLINPTEDVDDAHNYHSRIVILPTENLYQTEAISEVWGRWIPQGGRVSAQKTGNRLYAMFATPPLEASFRLHGSRDGELNLARYFSLETADVQDETGEMTSTAMAAVQVELREDDISVSAQAVTFTEDAATGGDTTRRVYIENDSLNVNLRTLHDLNYAVPTGGEVVEFYIEAGIIVSSSTTSAPALRTGSWPGGVSLTLTNAGSIYGKPGAGARGADGSPAGTAEDGGDALWLEYALSLDNTDGSIKAGGGGGGGGGGGLTFSLDLNIGGGGGGGGRGYPTSSGGAAGTLNPASYPHTDPTAGTTGTTAAAGTHGTGSYLIMAGEFEFWGGDGGDGGDYGEDGTSGTANNGSWRSGYDNAATAGGVGGLAVKTNGYDLTWLGIGDVSGDTAAMGGFSSGFDEGF